MNDNQRSGCFEYFAQLASQVEEFIRNRVTSKRDQISFALDAERSMRSSPLLSNVVGIMFSQEKGRGYSEGSVMVDRKTNKRYAPRDYGLVCGEDSYMCRKQTGYYGFILKIYLLKNLKNILLECNILILYNRSKYQVLFMKVKYLNGIEY